MGVGRGSPTRMDWSWALIWVLAIGHLVLGQPHHHSASSTSWTVWGSKPISGSLGLKPIFGSWVVKPVTILQPVTSGFASKPITGGSWGSEPISGAGSWGSNKPMNTGSRPQVGLELNSKWGPMAGTSAYKWSHSRPGSSSYQSVNFSYKMKPKPPPYKPPSAVTTKPPSPTPPSSPQPTLPPYKPPNKPKPTTPLPSTTPPSTTPPTLPDFLQPSPLLPLEDIDLPSGGAP